MTVPVGVRVAVDVGVALGVQVGVLVGPVVGVVVPGVLVSVAVGVGGGGSPKASFATKASPYQLVPPKVRSEAPGVVGKFEDWVLPAT